MAAIAGVTRIFLWVTSSSHFARDTVPACLFLSLPRSPVADLARPANAMAGKAGAGSRSFGLPIAWARKNRQNGWCGADHRGRGSIQTGNSQEGFQF